MAPPLGAGDALTGSITTAETITFVKSMHVEFMLTIINEDLSVFTVLCHIIDEEADEKFLMNEFNFGISPIGLDISLNLANPRPAGEIGGSGYIIYEGNVYS
uniref:Uncharacterized protein n=1 Tax=Coccidioides posadasii RMSCC 3488 TaxID=454284 RepID=A0A0J6FKC8_COCPO|nr:hypothetical protein CPAG_05618 [Coccidioides posadasii RMSCC 3488]